MDDPKKRDEQEIRRDERRRVARALRVALSRAVEARNPTVVKLVTELIEVLER